MQKTALKILGLMILLTVSLVGWAQKTDKVFLKNGDVLTGEMKSLQFAKLKLDVTGPGDIYIKWEEIINIQSKKIFQIIMRNGDIFITSMDSLFFKTQHATLDDIVEIVQIKRTFFKRLSGDVNLGFNYAKSSDNLQLNFASTIVYHKPKTETTLELNSILNHNSNDSVVSRKQDATIDIVKRLKNNFYINPLIGTQQNTQLGLKYRILVSENSGKIFINDNHHRLLAGAGLSFNFENNSSDSSRYKKSLEGLLVIQFKEFRYSTPKSSIDVQWLVYPGLTEWGRIRTDFQLNTKIEIVKDFNVGLSFYNAFDNRPAIDAPGKNDFGISFTLGYEFGK